LVLGRQEGVNVEQVIVNGLVLGMVYSLIALGLTLIFGIMGVLNFAHGQMYVIGGFVIYYLYGRSHLNFFLTLIVCALILGAIGAILNKFLFRRVIKEARREENTMLLAMGIAMLLEELSLYFFGEKSRGVPPVIDGVYEVFGAFLVAQRLFAVFLSGAFIAGLILFVKYTKYGMAMRALSQDKEAAFLQGVDIDKTTTVGFAIGAALTGVAGGLLTPIFMIDVGLGGNVTLKSFIMMLIGGIGSVPGAILGGVTLGFLESFGYAFLPGSSTYLIIFCALICLIIWRPQGIMGKPGD